MKSYNNRATTQEICKELVEKAYKRGITETQQEFKKKFEEFLRDLIKEINLSFYNCEDELSCAKFIIDEEAKKHFKEFLEI